MMRIQKHISTKIIAVLLIASIFTCGCKPKTVVRKPVALTTPVKLSPEPGDDIAAALKKIRELGRALAVKPELKPGQPTLSEQFKDVNSYELFCEKFFELTGHHFPQWLEQAQATVAKIPAKDAPELQAPKAENLVALLKEFTSHPERYTAEQQAAIASAEQLLQRYLLCLDNADEKQPGVKQLLTSLTQYACNTRDSLQTIVTTANDLKSKKLQGAEAQAQVQALFAEKGAMRQALEIFTTAGNAVPKVAESAKVKIEEAKAVRTQLTAALDLLKQKVDDPRIPEGEDDLKQEEKSFLQKVGEVVMWLHPLMWLIALLSLLFGGPGPGRGGKGGGQGNKTAKNSGPSSNNGQNPNNPNGGGQSVGNEAGKLPPKANPKALKGPEKGDYEVVAYELEGKTYLQVTEKAKPNVKIQLNFNLTAYDPAKFGELATVFAAGTLHAKSVALGHYHPVVMVFSGTAHEIALRWEGPESDPVVIGGPPIKTEMDEENIPIKVAPQEGTLWLYLIRKNGEMLIRIHDSDEKGEAGRKLVDLQLDTKELCQPGQESLIAIENGIGITTEGDDPYPVTIDFRTVNKDLKRMVWANANTKSPTVSAGESNQKP